MSSRWWQRAPVVVSPTVSAAAAGATGWLATVLIAAMLSPRPHSYLERQQGLGRSVGEWADEATAFLRADPPPGEMLNIGWVAANYLNFGVYPTRRVFVDGRWEAYPKPFLVETMRMPRDPAALSAMIEQWQPGFAVAEMRDPPQLDRVAELVAAGWGLVYVDSVLAVVVRPTDAGRAYIAEHPLDLEALAVVDALPEHPVLHAQQQIRVAGLLRRLGVDGRAEALRAAASTVDHPAVAADLVTFR